MSEDDNKKNKGKTFAIIALLIALIAFASAQEALESTVSGALNFSFNISGGSALTGSVTLIEGANVTLTQNTIAKTITIDSLSGGAVAETDPIAMENISSNFAAWSLDTYGSGSVNLSDNFTTCNQANEATTWDGTHGNCISVASSDDQTLSQVLTEGNTANMDIAMAGYNVTGSGNLYTKSETLSTEEIHNLIPLNLKYYFRNETSSVNSSYKIMNTTKDLTTTYKNLSGVQNGQFLVGRINEATNLTAINDGTIHAHTHITKVSGVKTLQVYGELWKRYGSSESLLLTTDTSPVIVSVSEVDLHADISSEISLNSTDILIWKLYAAVSGLGTDPTISIDVGGLTDAGLELPVMCSQLQLTNAIYDSHLANTSNPHTVTMAQIGTNFPNSSLINYLLISTYNNITAANISNWNSTYNATVDAQITALQSNDATDRSYVNDTFLKLSGGDMAGDVDFDDIHNITKLITLGVRNLLLMNSSYYSYALSDTSVQTYALQSLSQNQTNAWNSDVYDGNNQAATRTVFTATRYNGTTTDYYGVAQNTQLFFLGARASRGYNSLSPTRVGIVFQTQSDGGQWNTTSNPTAISFRTTRKNSTSLTERLLLDSEGSVILSSYSGSGNAITQVDSTGKLGRSAMATSDPDSNNANDYNLCWDGGTGTAFISTSVCTS